jgi:hypothetical protein
MKTKQLPSLPILAFCAAAFLAAGCASQPSGQPEVKNADVPVGTAYPVELTTKGDLTLTSDERRHAYLKFAGSEKTAEAFRKYLSEHGYAFVQDEQQAALVLELRGRVRVSNENPVKRLDTGVLDMGELLDRAGGIDLAGASHDGLREPRVAMDAATAQSISTLAAGAGSANPAAVGAGAALGVSMLADVTGFRGWFNAKVGDMLGLGHNTEAEPYKTCHGSGCDRWRLQARNHHNDVALIATARHSNGDKETYAIRVYQKTMDKPADVGALMAQAVDAMLKKLSQQ